MIIHKIGNVLDQRDTDFICHQVNCKGVMGAGLAKQIKHLLTPEQFAAYQKVCKEKGDKMLGEIQMLKSKDGRTIINAFGENIPTGTGCDTNYKALFECTETIKEFAEEHKIDIAIPGFIGCGLAGGDWNFVYHVIFEKLFQDSDITLYVYWLNQQLYQDGLRIANERKTNYRFEWNFNIRTNSDYEKFVETTKKEESSFPVNYKQAARLFCQYDNGKCIMVELQIPTYAMLHLLDEEECLPWIDAYMVDNMYDYSAECEIYSGYGNNKPVTRNNAEQIMLQIAKDLSEGIGQWL